MANTQVPAVAHDSIMFGNISHNTRAVMFELYNEIKEKQIFVAFDAPDDEDAETKKILYDNKVVQLFPEPRALFGKQWNK